MDRRDYTRLNGRRREEALAEWAWQIGPGVRAVRGGARRRISPMAPVPEARAVLGG